LVKGEGKTMSKECVTRGENAKADRESLEENSRNKNKSTLKIVR